MTFLVNTFIFDYSSSSIAYCVLLVLHYLWPCCIEILNFNWNEEIFVRHSCPSFGKYVNRLNLWLWHTESNIDGHHPLIRTIHLPNLKLLGQKCSWVIRCTRCVRLTCQLNLYTSLTNLWANTCKVYLLIYAKQYAPPSLKEREGWLLAYSDLQFQHSILKSYITLILSSSTFCVVSSMVDFFYYFNKCHNN